jgi:cell division protease FtsH
MKRLMIGMGGKAAESIFYGDNHVSVGAVQDLKQTNSLAQKMVGNFGMGDKLEAFYNENIDSGRSPMMGFKYSEKTKDLFDKECLKLVTQAYDNAKKILTENNGVMQIMVDKLLNNYTLYGKDIYESLKTVVDVDIIDTKIIET